MRLPIEISEEEWKSLNKRVRSLEDTIANSSLIGIDVGFKEQTTIVIVSKLNKGQIRIIETNFDNLRSLENFVETLKNRYGSRYTVWDDIP